jgi:uncharacterized protein (DUF1330 family)
MTAYVIADNEVLDAQRYQEYATQGGPIIKQFGGRVIARGSPAEVLEGDWSPRRLVVIEFESAEKAKAWYFSDAYNALKPIKNAAAKVRTILVQGA